MIVIIDYGVGNLFSLISSFKKINQNVVVSADKKVIEQADKLILPGVGAFSDAMKKLKETGLDNVVIEESKKGKPILGICLGMQLLFDKSFEFGEWNGLGLIPGEVVPFKGKIPGSYKIPQIGWNRLKFAKSSKLFKYIQDGDYVYFVHSYFASNCDSFVSSTTDYCINVTASVEKDNVYGCQFHPEKSGDVGLNILRAFSEIEVEK